MLARLLGHALPDWYSSISYAFMLLSEHPAIWACRWAGVSREGLKFEVIERDARAALVPFLGEPPEFEIKDAWIRQARVDREGIEAKRADGKWKRVLWRDVEACTFKGTLNAVGGYISTTFTLQGSREMPLLQFSPSAGDADRLLPAIRFYLRGESLQTPSAST